MDSNTDHGSRITDHGSRITDHGSRITDHGSRGLIHFQLVFHSGLMPASFATRAHFASSLFTSGVKISGPLPMGSVPRVARRARTSSVFNALSVSSFSRATIAFGVFAGAKKPYHTRIS